MQLDQRYARRRACTTLAAVGLLAFAWAMPGHAAPATADAAPVEEAPNADTEGEGEGEQDAPAEPQTAAQWYEQGVELGSAEDYVGAAAAFLRSYALKPTAEALFNAAVAYENADDAIAAIRAYTRCIAEPGRSEELALAAERAIESLRPRVSTIKSVRYDEARPPAELFVNGVSVTSDEFPYLVGPGEVEVSVVDEGGTQRSERYALEAGESLVLDLRALLPAPELEPEPEPPPEPPPPEIEPSFDGQSARLERRAKRLRVVSLTTAGVAGATGIAAATLGLLATDARRRYEDQTCLEFDNGTCPEGFEIGDPQQQSLNYERYVLGATIVTGVSAGVALVALATGLVSIRDARASRRARERSKLGARIELRPSLGGFVLRF